MWVLFSLTENLTGMIIFLDPSACCTWLLQSLAQRHVSSSIMPSSLIEQAPWLCKSNHDSLWYAPCRTKKHSVEKITIGEIITCKKEKSRKKTETTKTDEKHRNKLGNAFSNQENRLAHDTHSYRWGHSAPIAPDAQEAPNRELSILID